MPTTVHAVTTVSDSLLSVTPAAPAPRSQAKVMITNPADIPRGGGVRWFVDDVERTDEANARSISVTTKGVGEETTVRAEISTPGQPQRSLTATIAPIRLDLVIDADNRVPNFYRGRNLPSGSSPISATALVFGDNSGPYSYVWRVNNQQHDQTVGNRNNQITFKPGLDYSMQVAVEVYNQAGALVAQTSRSIPLTQPEIHFYEANPLRGLVPQALEDPYYFMNDEITIQSEPYYLSGSMGSQAIKWMIDGNTVAGDVDNPLALSISKTEDSGQAEIGLRIINTSDYMETANASLTVTY